MKAKRPYPMDDHYRLWNAERGIIIAADVSSIDDLRKLCELGGHVKEVVAIKVGFSLALRFGLPHIVKTVRDTCNLPVIYDHQKAGTDIPSMGKPFAEICRDSDVRGVILFPHAGPKTLEAFILAIFNCGLTPIVGLVMTHQAYLKSEGGFIDDSAPDTICRISIDAGVRHYVLPGTKTEILTGYSNGLLKEIQPATILMPGIGTQGGSIKAAFEAIKGHNPFAIIGSAIYNASNPKAVLENFVAEILS